MKKKAAETGRRLLGYAGQRLKKTARNVDHERLDAQRDRRESTVEVLARQHKLAQLGERAIELLRHMRAECNRSLSEAHAQGYRSGTALFIEDFARSLGLLDGEEKP